MHMVIENAIVFSKKRVARERKTPPDGKGAKALRSIIFEMVMHFKKNE